MLCNIHELEGCVPNDIELFVCNNPIFVQHFFVNAVCVRREDGFHMDLEDFLLGLLSMCNELVRLTIPLVQCA